MQNYQKLIIDTIAENTGRNHQLISSKSISGGDINEAFKIETNEKVFFAKCNYESKYPGMFAAEAKGLDLLKSAGEIHIPDVVGHGTDGELAVLVLNFIDGGASKKGFYYDFGARLAKLHQHTNSFFGLEEDNYIGSLPQTNSGKESWFEFFVENRIEFQLRMAINNQRIGEEVITKAEKLFHRLENFFPLEAPSLLHGDLWGGNYMINRYGEPVLIDPAVYYGHRFMDLGMTRLFGGFNSDFYNGYNSIYLLERGWEDGAEIANLYPLLVHVNLFGGGYASSVKSTINRFV